ncbi:CidA/LrgA family protein [Acidisoma cellulosilytica]|uniref:CidA/LrgA family protein n=1 Tax=Acidisoma cellulosilyticum TaxID=2802395 RepID=A0A963YZ50_9PROT|nr:CidA/LrgA family protein [Acidisoma cellulosilyticum]MCB8879730.1 CidA/LrgA family protein [Acidisoma cellulosilyticum]
MIDAIALLFVCLGVGECLHRVAGLPLPPSVIGLLVLLLWLAVMRRERPLLNTVSGWLTAHLSLMFVPAAVGLINQGPALARYGIGLVVATTVSTLLTMLVTVSVFRFVVKRVGSGAAQVTA